MNNYDYIDYDSNYITGLNNMMNNANFYNTFTKPSYSLANISDGYIRGNMFNNLYQGYQNYRPITPTISSKQEELLNKILAYNFALTDLNLYLDLNPNNTSMINLYKQYLQEEKKLCTQYETNYGPLTTDGIKQNNWVWDNSPWPWEVA